MNSQEQDSDGRAAGLIRRARTGEREAIDALCSRVRPGLEQFIDQHLPPAARRWTSPEDISQSVLLEMVRQLPTLAGDATWDDLLRRTRRTAGFRIRDSSRNHSRDVGESTAPMEACDPAGGAPSAGPVTSADYRRWLEGLVDHLPSAYADVVRLCAFDGLSFVEAAERLGLSADAVRKRYNAARRILDERRRIRAGD